MTNELRPGLPPLPRHMADLPIDRRGYPVPFFVALVNGEPDHRVVDPRARWQCMRFGLCWLCGKPLGTFRAFVVGPICAINRISSEPPSHLNCARYAVQACPFLSHPHAKRREACLPHEVKEPAGIHLTRNPGVALILATRTYTPFRVGDGMLFEIGPAESMGWYAEGRPATREEVKASIAGGLPSLIEAARVDGAEALRELDRRTAQLMAQVEQQFAGDACE